ncbi:TPA: hypothetical protein ACXC99_003635 [Clostridium botulinum]
MINKSELALSIIEMLMEQNILNYSEVMDAFGIVQDQFKNCKTDNKGEVEVENKQEVNNIVNISLDTKEIDITIKKAIPLISSSLSENLAQEFFNRMLEAQQSISGDILSNKKTPIQNKIKKVDLSQVSVKDLADELVKHKDCVKELIPEPYEKYSILMEKYGITDLGPATILVIID